MDFYIQAAAILTKLDNKLGSIKGLTLQSGDKSGSRLYALILETLKYRDVLRQVIEASGLLVKERRLSKQENLPLVLVHDLLLNKKGIVANAGPFKDAVLRHKTRLHAEWVKAKIKMKVKDDHLMAKVDATFVPRWARINTLKVSRTQMMDHLQDFKVVASLAELELDCVYVDEHIPNLLAFHPLRSLGTNKHYLDGSLILQNKASCIPAVVLNPPAGATVIDTCAAPGNKTSHLAAILQNDGHVFAFEKDTRRVQVLRNMLAKSGAVVDITHGDFTRTDPHDPRFSQVTHLLLDPSCSGSGIVNRLDYLTQSSASTAAQGTNAEAELAEEEEAASSSLAGDDQTRLESLASFQVALLLHAMSFPKAQKITYSTCSVHVIENEAVVMSTLDRAPPGWTLAERHEVLPAWPHRGLVDACRDDARIANGLIRAKPGALGTIGFFVACFVKRTAAVASRKRPIVDTEPLFLPDTTSPAKPRKKKKKKKKQAAIGGGEHGCDRGVMTMGEP